MTLRNETPENANARAGLPMPADRIQRHFKRILASPAFRVTEAQNAFLEFVVKKTLSGNSEEIKGYTDVVPGNPADKAGIKAKDIITVVNGEKVQTRRELPAKAATLPVGETTKITVARDGQEKTLIKQDLTVFQCYELRTDGLCKRRG